MIDKERLEELIKQKATVYECLSNEEISLSNICHIFPIISGKCIMDYKLLVIDERGCVYSYLLSWLKEDVETAKFEKRYQNITRTETLSLPTFEEFTINDKYNYYGTSYFEFGDGYRLIVKLPSEDDDCEFIGIDVNDNCELYHWEEATKENYLEACELCRKLFLGEEV